MREGTIPPNWTDLVQRSSQSGTTENIELKNTWFTTYHEEDNSKPQVTFRELHKIIMRTLSLRCSPYSTYKKFQSDGERKSLK